MGFSFLFFWGRKSNFTRLHSFLVKPEKHGSQRPEGWGGDGGDK